MSKNVFASIIPGKGRNNESSWFLIVYQKTFDTITVKDVHTYINNKTLFCRIVIVINTTRVPKCQNWRTSEKSE